MNKLMLIFFMSSFISPDLLARPEKIIIFWYGMGMGHRVPAERIANYIIDKYKSENKEIDVQLIDIKDFSIFDERSEETGKQKYLNWATKEADSYTQFFEWHMEKHPSRVKSNINLFKLVKFLSKEKPKAVINTFWGAAHALYLLKKKFPEIKNMPSSLLYTDYGVRKFVFMVPRIEKIFFGSDKLAQKVFSKYPDLEKYSNSFEGAGIPIDISTVKELAGISKESIKESLGLSADKRIITLARGGEAQVPLVELLVVLLKGLNVPNAKFQIVVLAGNSKEDKKEIDKIIKKYGNGQVVKVGFIPNNKYLEYVRASDLFISKPGGVGITEAALSEVPLILMSGLGGQEADNLHEFVENGLSFFHNDSEGILNYARNILEDSNIEADIIKKQREYFSNYDSMKIARWAMVQSKNNVTWSRFRDKLKILENRLALEDKIDLSPIALKNWYYYLNDLAQSDIRTDKSFKAIFARIAQIFMNKALVDNKNIINKYKDIIKNNDLNSFSLNLTKWELFETLILDRKLHQIVNREHDLPDRVMFDEIIRDLSSFIETREFESFPRKWEFTEVSFHQKLANYFYMDQHYSKAMESIEYIFRSSIAENINESIVQLKGDILIKQKRFKDAIDHYRKFLKKSSKLYGVQISLAGLYSDLNYIKKSENQIDRLLERKNNLSESDYFRISSLHIKNGSDEKAASLLFAGLLKRPHSLTMHSLLIRIINKSQGLQIKYNNEFQALKENYKKIEKEELKKLDDLPLFFEEN